jgi:hypothetical protein
MQSSVCVCVISESIKISEIRASKYLEMNLQFLFGSWDLAYYVILDFTKVTKDNLFNKYSFPLFLIFRQIKVYI